MHPRLRALLLPRVRAALAPRSAWLAEMDAERASLGERGAALTGRLGALSREARALSEEIRLFREPFHAEMTVNQAWLRHPAARTVFARHHLPACDRCAVRFEETVAEAAAAYGLDGEALIRELNALIPEGSPSRCAGG